MVVSLISAESTHTPFCTEGVDAQLFLSHEILCLAGQVLILIIFYSLCLFCYHEIVYKQCKILSEGNKITVNYFICRAFFYQSPEPDRITGSSFPFSKFQILFMWFSHNFTDQKC